MVKTNHTLVVCFHDSIISLPKMTTSKRTRSSQYKTGWSPHGSVRKRFLISFSQELVRSSSLCASHLHCRLLNLLLSLPRMSLLSDWSFCHLFRLSPASVTSGFFCPSSSNIQGTFSTGRKCMCVYDTFWVIDQCLLKIHWHLEKELCIELS